MGAAAEACQGAEVCRWDLWVGEVGLACVGEGGDEVEVVGVLRGGFGGGTGHFGLPLGGRFGGGTGHFGLPLGGPVLLAEWQSESSRV